MKIIRYFLLSVLFFLAISGSVSAQGILGITLNETTPVIIKVYKNTPAAKYKLQVGDFIEKINKETVKDSLAVKKILNSIHPNQSFTMEVARNGKKIKLKLKKEELTDISTLNAGEYPARYTFGLRYPKPNALPIFEDEQVKISFNINQKNIAFVLQNKTPTPIKIDWNQISAVAPDGQVLKFIHRGINFTDRHQPQLPTTIPPMTSISEVLQPINYISYDTQWKINNMFPNAPEAKNYIGETIALYFPLEITAELKDYNFVFSVDDVEM